MRRALLIKKAKREAAKLSGSHSCSSINVFPLRPTQTRQDSPSRSQRGAGGSPNLSFVDRMGVSAPSYIIS